MTVEAIVGSHTLDQGDVAVLGMDICLPAPQQNHLLELLGTNNTAFMFLEKRAVDQLAHTPPKEQLIPQLLATAEFVKNAMELQDKEYHKAVIASDGRLSDGIWKYRRTLERQTQRLTDGLAAQRRIVQDTNPAIIHQIQYNLSETDEDMSKPMEERVYNLAMRFPGKAQIVTDGDGTLTTNTHEYLRYIPGSLVAESRVRRHGRNAFPFVFSQNWREPLILFPHLFELVGREFATVRPGVFEFFTEAKQNGVQISILTANFEPVTNGFLQQNPQASDGVIVWGVTPDDITSTDKEVALQRFSYTLPDNPVIYIGDGESDKSAAEAREDVLVYFALEGSPFERYLQEKGARYFTYDTFTDIQEKIEELGLFAKSEKSPTMPS